jgi:hypothetical protein
MGTKGKAEKWKTQREVDDKVRRSMIYHRLTEEDTRDRDTGRKLVLGEGKPLNSVEVLRGGGGGGGGW